MKYLTFLLISGLLVPPGVQAHDGTHADAAPVALFPRNYAQIAGALMQGVIARLGDDGAREMLVTLGQQLGTAEPAPDPHLPHAAVAEALAQRLDQLGYEAVATQRGGEAQVEAGMCAASASGNVEASVRAQPRSERGFRRSFPATECGYRTTACQTRSA